MQVADVRKQRQDPHATSGAGIAPVPRYARDAVAPFIAADIGGTHARVGLVVADRGGAPSVRVLHYHRYRCAEWANLTSLLQNFLEELAANPSVAGTRVSRCVVACAGYVLDERIVNENLPWPVSVRDIREHLGIAQIEVLNDFAAVAWATQCIGAGETRVIIDAPPPATPGPVLVMGPGTGLGSAVWLPGPPRPRVLSTEAGQVSLAPGNARERAILGVLARERDYVSFEDALSGPGLLHLYRAICELDGRAPALPTPATITAAALADADAAALEAVQVFCGLLGSFAGDLVLLYGASGGVYLAGGILPQILPLLLASTFAERYFNKGVMRAYLQQVPVRLIEHGQLGVIGAALWYLDERCGG
jgi:glucokinase